MPFQIGFGKSSPKPGPERIVRKCRHSQGFDLTIPASLQCLELIPELLNSNDTDYEDFQYVYPSFADRRPAVVAFESLFQSAGDQTEARSAQFQGRRALKKQVSETIANLRLVFLQAQKFSIDSVDGNASAYWNVERFSVHLPKLPKIDLFSRKPELSWTWLSIHLDSTSESDLMPESQHQIDSAQSAGGLESMTRWIPNYGSGQIHPKAPAALASAPLTPIVRSRPARPKVAASDSFLSLSTS